VSAFSIDRATGKLTALNTVSTKGNGRCHLAVDHTGKTLLAGLQDTEPTL
jgi:6-phosphogluconolactonase